MRSGFLQCSTGNHMHPMPNWRIQQYTFQLRVHPVFTRLLHTNRQRNHVHSLRGRNIWHSIGGVIHRLQCLPRRNLHGYQPFHLLPAVLSKFHQCNLRCHCMHTLSKWIIHHRNRTNSMHALSGRPIQKHRRHKRKLVQLMPNRHI